MGFGTTCVIPIFKSQSNETKEDTGKDDNEHTTDVPSGDSFSISISCFTGLEKLMLIILEIHFYYSFKNNKMGK